MNEDTFTLQLMDTSERVHSLDKKTLKSVRHENRFVRRVILIQSGDYIGPRIQIVVVRLISRVENVLGDNTVYRGQVIRTLFVGQFVNQHRIVDRNDTEVGRMRARWR